MRIEEGLPTEVEEKRKIRSIAAINRSSVVMEEEGDGGDWHEFLGKGYGISLCHVYDRKRIPYLLPIQFSLSS